MSSSNPIQYFVTNWKYSQIFVFNEDWNFISAKSSFSFVHYMILLDSNIYITGDSKLWKTDERLNVLVTHANSIASYRGLYYDSVKRMINVALYNLEVIVVFNMDLTINKSISLTPYRPWSVNSHYNELNVRTTNGTILVIADYQIIKN
jgi:hypothetical protein